MTLLNLSLIVVAPLLAMAVIAAFIRLARGPSLPDRVIALDLMVTLGIGIISVYAVANDQPAFLDVAVILALISFLATIAFAYYMERSV
jgi:multicomponent Na+:H+ antiporter subunit F